MYKKIQFRNKARLIEVPFKDTKAVTIFFLFGVGSRYESLDINGVSHFIEHLMFKGTKKRPTTLDISKELDRVGAEFNAMTSKDYTGYYIKINYEKVGLAIDVLSDMILNSKFDKEEIDRERGVIVEEINMYNDNPLLYIESLFEEAVFAGNPLSREISGPAEVIRKITREKIVAYRDKFYRADNVVVALAGRIDNKIRKLVEEKFINKLPVDKGKKEKFSKFDLKQKSPRIKIQYKDSKQVQLALGFPTFGYNDRRVYALHLLSIILGGNMSSRLFVSIRERRGLAYFVRCYPNYFQDTGNIVIQSGLDINRLEEAIKVIIDELKAIKKTGATAKELADAKEFLRGKIILNLEDSSNLAEYYAKQEILTDKIYTPEEKMMMYQKVTIRDIQNIAKEFFVKNRLNLALIGPFRSAKKFYPYFKI